MVLAESINNTDSFSTTRSNTFQVNYAGTWSTATSNNDTSINPSPAINTVRLQIYQGSIYYHEFSKDLIKLQLTDQKVDKTAADSLAVAVWAINRNLAGSRVPEILMACSVMQVTLVNKTNNKVIAETSDQAVLKIEFPLVVEPVESSLDSIACLQLQYAQASGYKPSNSYSETGTKNPPSVISTKPVSLVASKLTGTSLQPASGVPRLVSSTPSTPSASTPKV